MFKQKNTFASNFDKSQRFIFELAGAKFSEKTGIKVWIEEEAFDSLGRFMEDDFSIHLNGDEKEKKKWHRFFKQTNKKKLIQENENTI